MTARRRGRGEGSVYRRSDGRWVGTIEVASPDGRRQRRAVYGRTRNEAAQRLRELQATIDAGRLLPDGKMTVGGFLDRWLDEVVKPRRSHGHWRNCEGNVRLHIKPVLGRVPLVKLTPLHVEQMLNKVRAKGMADDTVRLVHATLRAALTVARRWRLVHDNVAMLVEPVTVRHEEVQPFTFEELARLVSAAADDRLRAYLTVAIALGLRPGEARALRWDDVDLEGPQPHIRIRAAFSRAAGGHELGEPKARSRRIVPMPDQAVAALAGHRGRQEAERALAGPLWQEDGFVFSTALGRPLSDKVVSGWFTRLLKRAQVGHGRLYDCRHTAASLLLAQGVHARVIMELLGHSTFRLTMDTYTHVLPPSLQEAARAMNAALGKVEALSQSDSRAAR